jgi:hypothetical protein
MRLTVWGGVALVTVAIALAAAATLHATAPRSCDQADASRHSHLLVQAEKKYSDILSEEPSSKCARRGMNVVLAVLCSRAKRLADDTRTDEAAKAYTSLLAKEPPAQYTCAIKGLNGIPKPPGPQTVTIQGPPGPPGKSGTDGKDGTDGTDGEDGTDGTDGEDGTDGTDGTNGKDGKDGTNGKGRQGRDER